MHRHPSSSSSAFVYNRGTTSAPSTTSVAAGCDALPPPLQTIRGLEVAAGGGGEPTPAHFSGGSVGGELQNPFLGGAGGFDNGGETFSGVVNDTHFLHIPPGTVGFEYYEPPLSRFRCDNKTEKDSSLVAGGASASTTSCAPHSASPLPGGGGGGGVCPSSIASCLFPLSSSSASACAGTSCVTSPSGHVRRAEAVVDASAYTTTMGGAQQGGGVRVPSASASASPVPADAASTASSIGYRSADASESPQPPFHSFSADPNQRHAAASGVGGFGGGGISGGFPPFCGSGGGGSNTPRAVVPQSAHGANEVRVWEVPDAGNNDAEATDETDDCSNANVAGNTASSIDEGDGEPLSPTSAASHAAVSEMIKCLITNKPLSEDSRLLQRMMASSSSSSPAFGRGGGEGPVSSSSSPPLMLTWSGVDSREALGQKRVRLYDAPHPHTAANQSFPFDAASSSTGCDWSPSLAQPLPQSLVYGGGFGEEGFGFVPLKRLRPDVAAESDDAN